MLTMAGTPFIRDGLIFHLSDISIRVAPECSGIHSTYILLITSLLAGYLFLDASWKRAVLALFVLPLALLRNGFRVFTISELCVHVGPQMIDSPIHHKGGPIFFALSLIPFFILLVLLQRYGRINKKAPSPSGN
jgi:exosortase/archaeosortase family protein